MADKCSTNFGVYLIQVAFQNRQYLSCAKVQLSWLNTPSKHTCRLSNTKSENSDTLSCCISYNYKFKFSHEEYLLYDAYFSVCNVTRVPAAVRHSINAR